MVRFRFAQFFPAALAIICVAGCGAQNTIIDDGLAAANHDADLISNGREVAERRCVSCHAVSGDDISPRSDAPPLSRVLADYAPTALADDFREGIHVGHADMPDFDFGPIGTDSVLAYLISIQES